MAYRFGKASGGEIPSGACDGHGWEYAETEDGDADKVPLWVARSLPGAGPPFFDSVRIGRVRPAYGAAVFDSGPGQRERVEHYEVLLDKGTWREPTEYDDEGIPKLPAGAVACGHAADGTPLYAAIGFMGDDHVPSEITEDVPGECKVLVSSNHDEHAAVSAPLADAPTATAPPAGVQVAGASAVVSVVDCRNEVVEITNPSQEAIDLSGWKLRDRSSRKAYSFPTGTIVAPGASVRVRSGPGAANIAPGELAWTTANVWDNSGDTAYLENPAGTVMSTKDS